MSAAPDWDETLARQAEDAARMEKSCAPSVDKIRPQTSRNAAVEYVQAGLVLVPISAGRKGPNDTGWNLRENCIATETAASRLNGQNLGLAHAYSRTCAVDVDDLKTAVDWFSGKNLDFISILMDPATVQISSGRDNRAKILYRLPDDIEPLPSKKIKGPDSGDIIDFRCGTHDGLTVQDVLPPSIHPDTEQPYAWKGDWHCIPPLPDAILRIWQGLITATSGSADKAQVPDGWETVDLDTLPLSKFARALITDGDVQGKYMSRSEAIYAALKDLIRAGATDEQICRVLTDPSNQISQKALENGKGDQQAAMRWIAGQVGKARAEIGTENVVNPPVHLDEDSLALAFAAIHEGDLRYCHTHGSWFQFDGSRWRQEQTQLAFHWARELCRKHNTEQKITVSKVRTAGAVETYARADRRLAVTGDHWNRDPWLLATPASTVDLRTGQMRKADPLDCITQSTSVAPEQGRAERWLSFLDQITSGDRALQRFLQQIAGYCLTGSTREHALFFLYGPGGNGKSVFVDTLMEVSGDYSTNSPMETFTASKFDRHPTELADLASARMVSASETEEGRAWAESRIKQLTGGDPVKARFMRQDFFQFVPQFKLVFLGNRKPALQNVDDASRRRFNIIPLTFQPKVPDLSLPEKLKVEHGQILTWMIAGCLDWQQNGLVRPEIVTSATAEYFEEQDLFAQWLDEFTEKKSDRVGTPTALLFHSWREYANQAGDNPGTQRAFRENMRRYGFERCDHTPGAHDLKGFKCIALKSQKQGTALPVCHAKY